MFDDDAWQTYIETILLQQNIGSAIVSIATTTIIQNQKTRFALIFAY